MVELPKMISRKEIFRFWIENKNEYLSLLRALPEEIKSQIKETDVNNDLEL